MHNETNCLRCSAEIEQNIPTSVSYLSHFRQGYCFHGFTAVCLSVCSIKIKISLIYTALCYELLISKVLRYDICKLKTSLVNFCAIGGIDRSWIREELVKRWK